MKNEQINSTEMSVTTHFKEKQEHSKERMAILKPVVINNDKQPVESLNEKSSGFANTSKFPDDVYNRLPEQIKTLASYFEGRGRQKDIFFFSLLHTLSACMPKVSGVYFGRPLSPNLYGMVGGPSGTGKSAMEPALSITAPIIKRFAEINKERNEQYKMALAIWKLDNSLPKPEKPKPTLLKIPANSSAAGITKLFENSPHVVIAETEADTLVNIFGQKNFGNWSDLLRKFYHHEPHSCYRKTDNEYIELIDRNLTLLLTGTPQQIKNLLKGAETGLLSRVGFYVYDEKPNFVNPFGSSNKDMMEALQLYSSQVGTMFFELLERKEGIEFRFTPEQEQRFTEKFKPIVEDYYDLSGSDASSIAMRMGVIFFRIAMILTVIRRGYKENVLVCDDADFDIANNIIDTMREHALIVLSSFPAEKETVVGVNTLPEKIINGLDKGTFETKWLVEEFAKHGISRRTVCRVITQTVAKGQIRKVSFGVYEKVN